MNFVGALIYLPLFALRVIAENVTYADALHNILIGNITTNTNYSGLFDYYSEQPNKATANISLGSINNGEVLAGGIQLYEYATLGEKWGDAVFFVQFIKYNGQAYNYLTFEDLRRDLLELSGANDTLLDIWAKSSSDEDLSQLYMSLRGEKSY